MTFTNKHLVRSPCPGLNALANHDICPRSGKGYVIPILTFCLAGDMNIGAEFSLVVGTAGIGSNPDPLALSFDLDMLDRYDVVIKHDAPRSRADGSTGDDYSFNQTIWDAVLAYYKGMTNAAIPIAAKAKYDLMTTQLSRDPILHSGASSVHLQLWRGLNLPLDHGRPHDRRRVTGLWGLALRAGEAAIRSRMATECGAHESRPSRRWA